MKPPASPTLQRKRTTDLMLDKIKCNNITHIHDLIKCKVHDIHHYKVDDAKFKENLKMQDVKYKEFRARD